ncbi:MAG: gluconate 2-dehydrogenase subunit 3 family protein [Dehalococcoidia bacterium]
MTTNTNPLADAAFLRAFLDTVIPSSADGRMPGAGSLGVEMDVASAIESDIRSGPMVSAGLSAVAASASARHQRVFAELAPNERVAVVNEVLGDHPQFMNAFARHLYLAYYQHPRVLVAIGEPARPPFPEGFTVEPTDPELLAKLKARRQ